MLPPVQQAAYKRTSREVEIASADGKTNRLTLPSGGGNDLSRHGDRLRLLPDAPQLSPPREAKDGKNLDRDITFQDWVAGPITGLPSSGTLAKM